MKRLVLYLIVVAFLASCSNSGNGELVGTRKKSKPFYQPDPYGMVFIPQGSYTMGAADEDITNSHLVQPKAISVSAFFMDETEITNDEYRQFVGWVKDSIARTILGDVRPDEYLIEENIKTGEVYDPPYLNWKTDIEWDSEDQDVRDALEEMYLPEHERYFRRKEVDTRKLMYSYYWVDLHAAAKKDFAEEADYRNEMIAVYPDTLAWIHDYTYSFNDPLTEKYFWHPAYDHYPVVGVNWRQARAFCIWRTELLNSYLRGKKGQVDLAEFRLPTEAEWEWAARGGYGLNPYPWGGPYTRNEKGCFLANFKPLRGNYIADGGLRTVIVAHYPPNDWGLYDMAGNVAEWTSSAFWKDVAHYMQVTTRAYEYQDTAKSYIGFRTIQPFLGRNKGDNPNKASRVYH